MSGSALATIVSHRHHHHAALKKYGMMLADNGSNWYISGATDDRWNNDELHELRFIRGSDFETVDTSSLMVNVNSGQAAVGPLTVSGTIAGPQGAASGRCRFARVPASAVPPVTQVAITAAWCRTAFREDLPRKADTIFAPRLT